MEKLILSQLSNFKSLINPFRLFGASYWQCPGSSYRSFTFCSESPPTSWTSHIWAAFTPVLFFTSVLKRYSQFSSVSIQRTWLKISSSKNQCCEDLKMMRSCISPFFHVTASNSLPVFFLNSWGFIDLTQPRRSYLPSYDCACVWPFILRFRDSPGLYL